MARSRPLDSQLNPDCLVAEYEAVIQSLQEQLHTVKGKLAVAEDSLRRREEDKQAHPEARPVSKSLEKEANCLKDERNFWETKAHILEQKLTMSLIHSADFEVSSQRTPPTAAQEGSEEQTRESQAANEQLTAEVGKLREKICQFEDIQIKQTWLKADLMELEMQMDRKEELLKAANKRFLQVQKRVEALERENVTLTKTNQVLEQERRRASERWQRCDSNSLAQRTKAEGGLKSRISELEESEEQLRTLMRQKDAQIQELQKRVSFLEQCLKETESALSQSDQTLKRFSLHRRLESQEKETLARMNESLSIKLHRAEQALKQVCVEKVTSKSAAAVATPTSNPFSVEANRLQSQHQVLASHLLQHQIDSPILRAFDDDIIADASAQVNSPGRTMRVGKQVWSSASLSPVPGEGREGWRSKTPSRTDTSKSTPNPQSPLLAQTARDQSESNVRSWVQEVMFSSTAIREREKLSRRTGSDRKEWKP